MTHSSAPWPTAPQPPHDDPCKGALEGSSHAASCVHERAGTAAAAAANDDDDGEAFWGGAPGTCAECCGMPDASCRCHAASPSATAAVSSLSSLAVAAR
eukprot:364374-Chlamydomonas_euryale.AAC.15